MPSSGTSIAFMTLNPSCVLSCITSVQHVLAVIRTSSLLHIHNGTKRKVTLSRTLQIFSSRKHGITLDKTLRLREQDNTELTE